MALTARKSRARRNAKVVLVKATAAEIIAGMGITPQEMKRVDAILKSAKILPRTRARRVGARHVAK